MNILVTILHYRPGLMLFNTPRLFPRGEIVFSHILINNYCLYHTFPFLRMFYCDANVNVSLLFMKLFSHVLFSYGKPVFCRMLMLVVC